jgi:hypothetical protein
MEPYSPPPRTKILLAVTPELQPRFMRILERHDLTVVASSSEAVRALKQQFGLVVLSVHFDESQMFQLLGDIRLHSGYRKVPILCVLGNSGRPLSDITIEGLDHAVKAMRANGFLELQHFPESEAGDTRIARIADFLILLNGDLQHIARATGESVVPLERRKSAAPGV